MPLHVLPPGFAPSPPMRLTPPIVCPPSPGTMAHSVNPEDTAFTRCHRRTSGMISLDQSQVASVWASPGQRLACRVCRLECQKAEERVRTSKTDRVGSGTMAATNLTPRQTQVLDLWLAGKTYKEVAQECGISGETVNPHLKAIRKKLGATGISRDALRQARG